MKTPATRRAPIASVLNFHEFGTDLLVPRAALRPPRLPSDMDDRPTIPCGPPDGCVEVLEGGTL